MALPSAMVHLLSLPPNCIYDNLWPAHMGRHFWSHLPLSWMCELTVDFILYYILFYDEEARDDDSRLWVLVLKDTRRQRPHRWT